MYRHEIDEQKRTLKLWVRWKKGNKLLRCSNCSRVCKTLEEVREREVQDLPWRKHQTTVVVEYYRVRCPKCGVRVELLDRSRDPVLSTYAALEAAAPGLWTSR